jgi:DNA-3-methyladenine glycosylase II
VATILTLPPIGPFSLRASSWFLEGFTPAAHKPSEPGHLHLAFPVDGSGDPAGVCAQQPDGDDHPVELEIVVGTDEAAIGRQVARVLALDQDGSGFEGVAERDPVVARLGRRYRGLRPVAFYSPYEAGAWALISARSSIRKPPRGTQRMAEDLGSAVEIHGEWLHAFPAPSVLAGLDGFPGLFGRKVEWLRGLARATMAGDLDADVLRSLPERVALERLRELPGFGPFTAGLALIRGANTPDSLPNAEPRLLRAVALAYGLPADPPYEAVVALAEAWRPYRTWVTLLLRRALEDETGEISGRRPAPT